MRTPFWITRAGREADVMLTSKSPTRTPLRIRMADHPGRNELDGGWWPQSRDLAVELADLVDHFPPERGRIVRALYSPPDWEPAPRRVATAHGRLKVGYFPHDDTHLILLSTSDRTVLRVLVVPQEVTDAQGEEALLAAATHGNAHTATSLLFTATQFHDVDPADLWGVEADTGAPAQPTALRSLGGN